MIKLLGIVARSGLLVQPRPLAQLSTACFSAGTTSWLSRCKLRLRANATGSNLGLYVILFIRSPRTAAVHCLLALGPVVKGRIEGKYYKMPLTKTS